MTPAEQAADESLDPVTALVVVDLPTANLVQDVIANAAGPTAEVLARPRV